MIPILVGHQDYFLAPLPGSITLFISSLGIHIVRCNPFIMDKPRDGKVPILPSTTRRGTTLNTSVALDSPSVMSKLLTLPYAHATISAEFENASDRSRRRSATAMGKAMETDTSPTYP
jgi:hypothetical protein